MAGSSSTPNDLVNLIESLSVDDEGSKAQQALSSILGFDVPLDDGVESAAGKFAEKLGLKSDNSLVQTATFVVTKAAILEGLQLIGIGGGLAKLDLGGFQMAQLMAKVDEINQKLDVVLTSPLKEAEEFLRMAMIHLESGSIAASIEELKKVKDKSVQAFQYTKGLGTTESLRNAVKTKQLKVFSEVLIQSYDGTKITPFFQLDKEKKRIISSLIEADIKDVQTFYKSKSISMFTLNKAEKEKKKQDMLDTLLRASYPYISEGRGFTSELAVVSLPYHLKLLPQFLPEGEEDGAWINISQQMGKPMRAYVWREGKMAMGRVDTGERTGEMASASIRGIAEVMLHFTGCFP